MKELKLISVREISARGIKSPKITIKSENTGKILTTLLYTGNTSPLELALNYINDSGYYAHSYSKGNQVIYIMVEPISL